MDSPTVENKKALNQPEEHDLDRSSLLKDVCQSMHEEKSQNAERIKKVKKLKEFLAPLLLECEKSQLQAMPFLHCSLVYIPHLQIAKKDVYLGCSDSRLLIFVSTYEYEEQISDMKNAEQYRNESIVFHDGMKGEINEVVSKLTQTFGNVVPSYHVMHDDDFFWGMSHSQILDVLVDIRSRTIALHAFPNNPECCGCKCCNRVIHVLSAAIYNPIFRFILWFFLLLIFLGLCFVNPIMILFLILLIFVVVYDCYKTRPYKAINCANCFHHSPIRYILVPNKQPLNLQMEMIRHKQSYLPEYAYFEGEDRRSRFHEKDGVNCLKSDNRTLKIQYSIKRGKKLVKQKITDIGDDEKRFTEYPKEERLEEDEYWMECRLSRDETAENAKIFINELVQKFYSYGREIFAEKKLEEQRKQKLYRKEYRKELEKKDNEHIV